jgi:serine/threonine-protein kinase
VLHKQLTHLDEVVARFEREAIAAANIGNPHVATATDFGRLDDGSFYLVLEYLSGKSLASLLKEGPLPTERALGIALQICRALEAAHAAGIVHRDLKPDNVMLIDKQGQQDYVKVLDFGIAKVPVDADRSGANLTRVGVVFGTPGYMSPEQSVGQVVDHRTDLYALGVILYEMLASRLPFDTDNLPELLAKQVASTPPPLPDHVDSAVSALVMRLLDKTADARPRDAEEVRRLLEELRAGEPAAAPDPTAPFERSWKRRPLVLALAVLVVLGTGFVFFLAEPTREGSEIASPVAAQRAEGLDVEPGATTTDQVAIELATRAMQSGLPASAAKARPQPSKAASGTAPKTNDSVQRASTSKEGSARADSAARSSRGKQKDRGKRRTGPGGIYIPPPSEWF